MPTSSAQNFRVGLVQLRCGPDPDENLARAVEQVQAASMRGAHVVCLPELFRTQYFCQREDTSLFDLAEPIPGPTTEKISQAARQSGVAVIASIFEKRAPGIYHNTAAMIDADGKLLGIYRKMHIPDDPLYYEKYYFTPGDLGFKAFNTSFGRIGTLVCWDQWYPEGARLTALQGAQVLFYPTAIGWHPAEKAQYGTLQHDAWRTIQRAHAIANGVYVAVVNRVGHETGNIRGNETAGTGLEFSSAIPSARCWPRPRKIRKRFWSARSMCELWKRFAATGLFCVTAALIATAPSRSVFWIRNFHHGGTETQRRIGVLIYQFQFLILFFSYLRASVSLW